MGNYLLGSASAVITLVIGFLMGYGSATNKKDSDK